MNLEQNIYVIFIRFFFFIFFIHSIVWFALVESEKKFKFSYFYVYSIILPLFFSCYFLNNYNSIITFFVTKKSLKIVYTQCSQTLESSRVYVRRYKCITILNKKKMYIFYYVLPFCYSTIFSVQQQFSSVQ